MPTQGDRIEDRIRARFLNKLSDSALPASVVGAIRELCEREQIPEVGRIMDALQGGVRKHAQD